MGVWFVDEIERNALIVADNSIDGCGELAPKICEVIPDFDTRSDRRTAINDICVS
jgi:hypothetical protein